MKHFRCQVLSFSVLAACGMANADSVYIALGDSITFGETNLAYVPSNGDRGYVADFASTLASRNGGIAPQVVNLAIDGETAASFLIGVGRTPPVVGRTDSILATENTHYSASPTTPQLTMFENTVVSETAAGKSVGTISITLGFNELGALASLPTNEALAMLPSTLVAYEANYSQVLTDVRASAPDATLYLLGYYNPFPANPTAPIFAQGGPELNAIIQSLAGEFGGYYVNTEPAFAENEAALTYLAQQPAGATSPGTTYVGTEPVGNVHPNISGYQAISNEIAAVPEPSTIGLFGIVAAAFGVLQARQICRA